LPRGNVKVSNRILGADIGLMYSKFVLIKDGKKDQILDTLVLPTPEGTVNDGELTEPEMLASKFRPIFKERRIKAKSLAVAISSSRTIIRELKLSSAIKDPEIPNAILFDLSQTFSDIQKTHYISYKIYSRNEELIKGIVSMCPKTIVDSYKTFAASMGIPFRYADVSPNCLAKASKFLKSLNPDAIILADIGYLKSEIMLIINGKLYLNRFVSRGSAYLDNMLTTRLGIAEEDTDKAKRNQLGSISISKDDIVNIAAEAYLPIEEQIRHTINYFSYNKLGNNLNHIYITGGGSNVLGLNEYYRRRFGIDTVCAGNERAETIENKESRGKFIEILPALGAAVRED